MSITRIASLVAIMMALTLPIEAQDAQENGDNGGSSIVFYDDSIPDLEFDSIDGVVIDVTDDAHMIIDIVRGDIGVPLSGGPV